MINIILYKLVILSYRAAWSVINLFNQYTLPWNKFLNYGQLLKSLLQEANVKISLVNSVFMRTLEQKKQ